MFEFLKGVKLKDTKLQATAQDGTKFEVKTTMPNNNKQQGGPQQAPPPKPMQPPRMQVPPPVSYTHLTLPTIYPV